MKQYKIKLKTKKTYEEDLEKLRQEFPEFDDSWMKVEKAKELADKRTRQFGGEE